MNHIIFTDVKKYSDTSPRLPSHPPSPLSPPRLPSHPRDIKARSHQLPHSPAGRTGQNRCSQKVQTVWNKYCSLLSSLCRSSWSPEDESETCQLFLFMSMGSSGLHPLWMNGTGRGSVRPRGLAPPGAVWHHCDAFAPLSCSLWPRTPKWDESSPCQLL